MTKYKIRNRIYVNKYWGERSKLQTGIVKLKSKGYRMFRKNKVTRYCRWRKVKVLLFEVQGQVKEEQEVVLW